MQCFTQSWIQFFRTVCHSFFISLSHSGHPKVAEMINQAPNCYVWHHVSLSDGDDFITLRPRHYGLRFADDTLKCILLNENVRIPIETLLKFVPKGPINNIPTLVQVMAWHRSGDKPLSEPMMVSLLTHICITRPQWVKKTYFIKRNHQTVHWDTVLHTAQLWQWWNKVQTLISEMKCIFFPV